MNHHHDPTARNPIAPRLGWGLLGQLVQRKSTRPGQHQSAFTLIESLVAIIVITITIVSVIPPIFWATATRVQNRRVEQAIQLAQGEIDRVRTGIERRDFTLADLPPEYPGGAANAPAPTTIDDTKLRSVSPGCNTAGDGRPPSQVTATIPVDTDPGGNCTPEFYVQVFRGTGVTPSSAIPGAVPDGLVMGVRVYSIAAGNAARTTLRTGLETKPGNIRATNGLGSQRTRPLAVQYSVIVRSNASDGLSLYRSLCRELGAGRCTAP